MNITDEALADMRYASGLVDDAAGTSEYQARLVALALIARHFLRESDKAAGPSSVPAETPERFSERKMFTPRDLDAQTKPLHVEIERLKLALATLPAPPASARPTLERDWDSLGATLEVANLLVRNGDTLDALAELEKAIGLLAVLREGKP